MTDRVLALAMRLTLTSILALENPYWDLVPNMNILGSGVLRSDSHSGLMNYCKSQLPYTKGVLHVFFFSKKKKNKTFILVLSMCMEMCLCVGMCI